MAWLFVALCMMLMSTEGKHTEITVQPEPYKMPALPEYMYSVKNTDTDSFEVVSALNIYSAGDAVLPKPEIKPVTYKPAMRPVLTSRNYVYVLRNLNESDLREKLIGLGFRNLAGYTRNELRFVYGAWAYDRLLMDVNARTKIPASVVFAYLQYEAMSQGVETDLFRVHGNPGGIKYRGEGKTVKAMDDCGGQPCDFSSTAGYEEMVRLWAKVFNRPRYKDCSGTPEEVCACLKAGGYHSAKNWKDRAKLARKYWIYRGSFPVDTGGEK